MLGSCPLLVRPWSSTFLFPNVMFKKKLAEQVRSDSVEFCKLMLPINLFSQCINNMWSKIPFKCHNAKLFLSPNVS